MEVSLFEKGTWALLLSSSLCECWLKVTLKLFMLYLHPVFQNVLYINM